MKREISEHRVKYEYWFLLVILVIGVFYRAYNLRLVYFNDNDVFLHASVMRQALSDGNLRTYELGIGNPLILEPLGLYYVTLFPALLIGLDAAILLTPLISGVLCIFIAYFLFKRLFNSRVALIACLILALSLAHAYRTSPNTYRGDGFYLTIFLASYYYFFKGSRKDMLISGVLLGLSASVWNGYPLGVLVIISGVIITSTLKFLKNEFSRKDLLNNSLLIASYYVIEWVLLLTGVVKDVFFTINRLLHALVIFSPLIINLVYLLTRKVRKSSVLIVLLVIGVVLLLLNARTINDVVSQGLFETSLFYKIGVSELLPPTSDLLYTMLSLTLYLLWPGLILLGLYIFKKRKSEHVSFLAWIIVSLYLMYAYSRYNFLASVTTACLTGFFLDYVFINLWKSKFLLNGKIFALLVLAVFFTFYTIDAVKGINNIGTRMNPYWLDAFNWVKSNLSPGMSVSWWDHGSWIQYYTSFPTVVDSISGQDEGRITRIAQFLMGNNTDYFKDWNASYLVLGGDVILYSGAVTGIAGIDGLSVSYVGDATAAMKGNESVIVYPNTEGYFQVYPQGTVYTSSKGGSLVIGKTFFANRTGSTVLNSDYNETRGCLVINPAMNFYFNDKACASNYVSLMYGVGRPGYELLYRNDYVVIYKIL